MNNLTNAVGIFTAYVDQRELQRRSIIEAIQLALASEVLRAHLDFNGLLAVNTLVERQREFLTDRKYYEAGKALEVLSLGDKGVYSPVGWVSYEKLNDNDLLAMGKCVASIVWDVVYEDKVREEEKE